MTAFLERQILDQQARQPAGIFRAFLVWSGTGRLVGQQPGQAAVADGVSLEQQVKSFEADFPERPGPAKQAGKLHIDEKPVESGMRHAVRVGQGEAADFQAEHDTD